MYDLFDGLTAFAVIGIFVWILVRRYGRPSIIRTPADIPSHHRYPTHNPSISFEKIRGEESLTRPFGKRAPPSLGSITLTPRQLEHVNIQRKLRNRPPLNAAGFNNAVAHAWDQGRRQPDTSSNWLTYLILYECFFAHHQASTVADTGHGLIIDPSLPYNGQVGEVPGAGAAGVDVYAPIAASIATPDLTLRDDGASFSEPGTGQIIDQRSLDALSDPNSFKGEAGSYQPGDMVGGYGAPQQAPEPAPTPAPDPAPSAPSFDSGPAPSFDSGGGGGGDGS